jgi:hypothetical protein
MAFQYSTTLRTAQVNCLLTQLNGADVAAWLASHAYTLNTFVSNGGNVYKCTTAGTSASSGGPSGTGSGITDNTAVWAYQSPTLKIFSGSEPVNVAASDPSGTLCTINLPATSLTASGGATTIAGTWSASASAGGTAASFRMYDGAGNCQIQGNVTSDLVLNNTNIASGQTVTVNTYTVTAGNS